MALALTIEDGTIVAGADSFATVAQIRDYNTKRGVKLPVDDDGVVNLALIAMDYLQAYEDKLGGHRTVGALQRLCFPRACVRAYNTLLPSNVIPQDIIDVQCYLAGIATTLDLYGNLDTRAVTKEKIGPLETDYSSNTGAVSGPSLPTVTAALKPYMKSGFGPLRSVRV